MRQSIRDALGIRLHRFHKTENETDAMELVRQLEPSLVITAPQFARGDGYELCRSIKGEEKLRHVGVILFVNKDEDYDTGRGVMAGVDQYFSATKSAERISELAYEVIDRMESQVPLIDRPSASLSEVESTRRSTPPPQKTADRAKSANDERIYHGFRREGSTPKDASAKDPFRDYFVDEAHDSEEGKDEDIDGPDMATWSRQFEDLSATTSEEVTRHIEQWLEMHYGERVDEEMRQEVRRTLQPLVQTIVRNKLNRLMED
ncbi:MAG: hypothetical protein P9L99_19130 [Candidatus Lernaella stagnicola]|nr:hypothetical protein [Candidatus Lernaella stagnicola]